MKKYILPLLAFLVFTATNADAGLKAVATGPGAAITALPVPTAQGGTGATTLIGALDGFYGATNTGNQPQVFPRFYDINNISATYPAQNIYGLNLDPKYMPHLRKCLAAVNAGTGRCLGVRMGSSTTIGINAAGTATWPNEGETLAKYLFSASIPAWQNSFSGYSFGTGVGSRVVDTRIALGGASVNFNTLGGGGFVQASATPFVFTPGPPIDTCTLYAATFGGQGTGTVQVGSGSTAAINEGPLGFVTATATSSTLTQGCKIAATSATIFFGAIRTYNSKQPGVDFMDVGDWGQPSSVWAGTSSPSDSLNLLASIAPDFLIIRAGSSDESSSVSASTMKTNLQTIITTMAPTTDIILESDNPNNSFTTVAQQAYAAALGELAVTNNLPFIDNFSRWGTYAIANSTLGFMSDTVHPNSAGYSDAAAPIADLITSVGTKGALNSVRADHISFQPGLMTAVSNAKAGFHKISQSSTVDNLEVSAQQFSCTGNPTITMYECGTSTTCASSPVTIGTATISAAGTVVEGTLSSAAITAGDYVAFAVSAGTCITLDIAATAQIHSN